MASLTVLMGQMRVWIVCSTAAPVHRLPYVTTAVSAHRMVRSVQNNVYLVIWQFLINGNYVSSHLCWTYPGNVIFPYFSRSATVLRVSDWCPEPHTVWTSMSVQQHLMPYATTFVGTPVDPTAVIATLASTWNLITKAARRKVQLVWMHSVSKWLFLHHFVTITTSGTSLSLFSPTKISYIFHNIGSSEQKALTVKTYCVKTYKVSHFKYCSYTKGDVHDLFEMWQYDCWMSEKQN